MKVDEDVHIRAGQAQENVGGQIGQGFPEENTPEKAENTGQKKPKWGA